MTATSHDSSLNLSCIDYTTNNTLQRIILDVVNAIIEQDSSGRGAWSFVVCRRVSMDHGYFEQDVASAIAQMINIGALYISHTELFDKSLRMDFVKVGSDEKNE